MGFANALTTFQKVSADPMLNTQRMLVTTYKMADMVLSRVRDLAINHPRSPGSRFVTVSAGIVSETPGQHATSAQFIARALVALRNARTQGVHRISFSNSK